MGRIYCVEFDGFIKVGKSVNTDNRVKALESSYNQKARRVWVSNDIKSFDSAECFAHQSLDQFRILTEQYSCDFDYGVDACVKACTRATKIELCGVVAGVDVKVDPGTGFINVTDFMIAAKKEGRSISASQFVNSNSVKEMKAELEVSLGMKPYFTVRGRGATTYFHVFIFIEFCRSMSASHKISAYKWLLNDMKNCDYVLSSIKKSCNDNVALQDFKEIK